MKTMKTFGYILILGALIFNSCDKALDINKDPYLPSETDAAPDLLFPSGVAYSAAKIGGDLELIGGFWAQHYTQNNTSNQYKNIDSYALTISSYNGIWANLFGGGMKDLYIAKEKAQAGGLWNYYLASAVMLAFDYHVLVDLYGDLPIKEGLQGDKGGYSPKWDEGKVVNEQLLKQLDEALTKVTEAKALPSMGNQDLVFAGDIDKWRKFAKSLKLKVLMRDFTTNALAIKSLLDEGDLLLSDARVDAFEDIKDKSNPLFESDRRALSTGANIRASKTLLSCLLKNNDPRIADFYETNDINGQYTAYAQGNYNATSTEYPVGSTSRAKLAATDPVYFMSHAEVEFLQAEAWVRLNDVSKAGSHYESAVKLAFSRWGRDATALLGTDGAYAFKPGAAELMVEQIITQKWIASARCQAWDAFYDQNRTGYPVVSTVPADEPSYVPGQYTPSLNTALVGNELPRRLPYPKVSSDNNPNTPKAVSINTKMWWHKK